MGSTTEDYNFTTTSSTTTEESNVQFVAPELGDAARLRMNEPKDGPVYNSGPPATDVWAIELSGKGLLLVVLFGILNVAVISWICGGGNCGGKKKYQPVYGVDSGTEIEEML